MLPALLIAAVAVIGMLMMVAAVGMLAGFAWALLLAGAGLVASAIILRRGMIGNG